jgi:glutathionylspermidine synthase
MQRVSITPRTDWKQKVEKIGFSIHSENDEPYWDESAYYELSKKDESVIKEATETIWKMCLHAVNFIISNKFYQRFHIPEFFIPVIESSWYNSWPYIYSRLDLAYKNGQVKLLEINPDTPTSLYEASVVQYLWKKEKFPDAGQFNYLESSLINTFLNAKIKLGDQPVYFSYLKQFAEDAITICYLGSCASEAGINTRYVYMEDLGWNKEKKSFVDLYDSPIQNLFKLYPYEWITGSQFAREIPADKNIFCMIEPPWKMILSSKALLPILWELYPGHKNLLPAYYEPGFLNSYARKPFRSRQGENILLVKNKEIIDQTDGDCGDQDYIYQKLFELPGYDNNHMLIGSWIIGDTAAGIGIRESANLITDKKSRFVPHLIL